MKKIFFTTIAASMLAVSANAAATAKNDLQVNAKTGCYEISSADDLDGFAQNVVNAGATNACAELTADIYYQGTTQLVKSDLSGLQTTSGLTWTPIGKDDNHPFQGSIDGQGHTIYGLYMNNSQEWDASLVGVALGGSVVKNLRVEDSFFKSSSGGNGGIIGKASAGAVLVENCSFKGRVEGGSNNGGIVGSVQEYGPENNKVAGNLTLINSFNEGYVTGKAEIGGLVGIVMKSGSNMLTLNNCYNVGTVDNEKNGWPTSSTTNKSNPLVGNVQSGATATAENVGCEKDSRCTSVVKSGVTQGDSATLALNFLNNKSGASDIQSEWNKLTNDEKIERLAENVEGIEVDTVWSTTKQLWITRTTIKTQLDLSENNALIIKEDVVADSITFDRDFKSGVASTIMVPFNYSVGSTMKAKFYEFANVSQDADGAWKVSAKQVSVLQAHTPYLIVPTADGELTFVGPFVLWANNNGGAYEKSIGNTAWKAVGVYTKKRWDVGVNEKEIGTIYGFAAQAKSEKEPGDFVRGGKKVAVLPMRSYLKYDASTDDESVVSTPTLTKMRAISSTEVASIEALPQRIEVELEDAPERVEIIESIEVPEGEETQDGEDLGEKPQGIAQSLMIRLDAQKADRWFNINGRNMNAKPKSQGAFIKNSTPVIVK